MKRYISYALLLVSSHIFCQDTISVSRLLAEANANWDRTEHPGTRYMNEYNQELPTLDKLEFRTETNQWNWQQQEMVLRAAFNTKREKDAQSAYTDNQYKIYQAEQLSQKERSLHNLYEFLYAIHFLEREEKINSERRKVLLDRKKTYEEKMKMGLVFNMDGVIKNQSAISKLELRTLRVKNDKEWIFSNLSQYHGYDSLQTISNDWISISKMLIVIERVGQEISDNAKVRLLSSKVELARSELEIERIKSRRVFDFAQIKYRNRQKDQFPQEWSVGVSLNIPTKSSNRVKKNEVMLDILEGEYKHQLQEENILYKISELKYTFRSLYDSYLLLQNQIENNRMTNVLSNNIDHPSIDVLTLIDAQEDQINSKDDLDRIEKAMYEAYLEIVKLSGLLSTKSEINFLSENIDTSRI